MKIPLFEPTHPKFIYINPKTNTVHLMLPLTSGSRVSLDNTCQAGLAFQEFFGRNNESSVSALRELTYYQQRLLIDLRLHESAQKRSRLVQIKHYISALKHFNAPVFIQSITGKYPLFPDAIGHLMAEPDRNLFSMHLRPPLMDVNLRFVAPVFALVRERGREPVLYNALEQEFRTLDMELSNPKHRLIHATLVQLDPLVVDFAAIQRALQAKIKSLFNLEVDLSITTAGKQLTQELLDDLMCYSAQTPASQTDYIKDLLNYCTPKLFDFVLESHFYSATNRDKLSLTTQYFLAIANIYCRSHNLSTANFGQVLDDSKDLSTALAQLIRISYEKSESVEQAILEFINQNQSSVQLNRPLAAADWALIKEQFANTFVEIKESEHLDEFLILDEQKQGKFIVHQGQICVDFAEFILRSGTATEDEAYFRSVADDFRAMNGQISHSNPCVYSEIDIDLARLFAHVDMDELQHLLAKFSPQIQQQITNTEEYKVFSLSNFTKCVSRVEMTDVESALTGADAQYLLQTPSLITDFSDRAFNCTAYEYAYWAKDIHMCRLLEQYMSDETRTILLAKCRYNNQHGLSYVLNGQQYRSPHFSLSPLKNALRAFINQNSANIPYSANNAAREKLPQIGREQWALPTHMAIEYCRTDHSFENPKFEEGHFFRNLNFKSYDNEIADLWYLKPVDDIDFAILRGGLIQPKCEGGIYYSNKAFLYAAADLRALERLDAFRDAELIQCINTLESSISRYAPL